MDLLSQSTLLVAVSSFCFGVVALSRNSRNKLLISFFVLCCVISVWALSFFLNSVRHDHRIYLLHLFFNVWLSPPALVFISFLSRTESRLSRVLRQASIVLALALSGLLVTDADKWVPIVRPMLYFMPFLIFVQIVLLMITDTELLKGIRPSRRVFIRLGGLVVLSTCVLDHVPTSGPIIPVIGNFGLIAYLFFLSQAITQSRMLNLETLISRLLVQIAVAGVLTALYAILVFWGQNTVAMVILDAFIASFLLLMLIEPLRSVVRHFTLRLLTQKHRRLHQIVMEEETRLQRIADRESLFRAIFDMLERALQPDFSAIYTLRADGLKLRRARAYGPEQGNAPGIALPSPPLQEILADHPLAAACAELKARGSTPILLEASLASEIERSASQTQREQLHGLIHGLRALGGNLLIPFFDHERILGFVICYVPEPPEPWGDQWGLLPVIYPYFEQAAQTLRSTEAYVKHRDKERLAELGAMAAGLAHEIRNPLGAIRGATQLLKADSQNMFLDVILEEVDRLNRVVTRFLDYSKPQPQALKAIELGKLADLTLQRLRPGLPEGLSLEFTPAQAPAWALVDPEQIQQVLINLINNATRSLTGKTDGKIQVLLEIAGPPDQQQISLSVSDNGRGIAEENLNKLFIPFFTTSPSGTGLGLSISQKIIEAHHGRIEVTSEEGRFARFDVVLPAYDARSNLSH